MGRFQVMRLTDNSTTKMWKYICHTYSKPRGAIRRRRNEGDRIWKKSLSGDTTLTCHKDNAINSDLKN
jgi:hypothetical protein